MQIKVKDTRMHVAMPHGSKIYHDIPVEDAKIEEKMWPHSKVIEFAEYIRNHTKLGYNMEGLTDKWFEQNVK